MKNNSIKQRYHPSLINEHLERINRINLITQKDAKKIRKNTSCNYIYQFLPNITKTITKNWNIIQINENLKEIFKSELTTRNYWDTLDRK